MSRFKSVFTRTRGRKVATAFGSFFVVAAVAALAAWLVSGQGDGRGRVGTLQALSVTAGNNNGSACYPGGTCAAHVVVGNPNGPLTIVALQAGDGTGTTSEPTQCQDGNISVNAQSGLSIPLPSGTNAIDIPDGFALSTNAPSGCQGVSFTKNLRVIASTP